MSNRYVAVIVTTVGTFRASSINTSTVAISVDGQSGIIDYITFDPIQGINASPEYLAVALRLWIYEHVRGIEILDERLSLLD